MDSLLHQIVADFKASYGSNITDKADLFLVERNMLEYLMRLGQAVMGRLISCTGSLLSRCQGIQEKGSE